MKFSIRDLLLVTAIVGVSIGWAVDHVGLVAKERAAAKDRDSHASHLQRVYAERQSLIYAVKDFDLEAYRVGDDKFAVKKLVPPSNE